MLSLQIQFVNHEIISLPVSIVVLSSPISSILESLVSIDDVVVSNVVEAPIVAAV